ncbi:ABC transporter substrate-binding protein [Aegicerativicinus sediminis]
MRFLYVFLVVIFLGCKNNSSENILEIESISTEKPEYANGFYVTHFSNYSELTINSPWPESDKVYKYAMVNRKIAASITFPNDRYDAIITTPIDKLIVTSTTHLPALDYLNETNSLVGFPELNYISNPQIRERISGGLIQEIGKNESLNTEKILNISPELVMGFSIDGTSKTFETIKNAGIPVLFNGDWTEKSPLGKAEWIKVFGLLFEKKQKSDSIFNSIEKQYNEAKSLASKAEHSPTAISGALYQDIWYLPYGTSPEGQLMNDANINYLWSDTKGSGSLGLSFETVLEKGENAELWLNPSNLISKTNLLKSNPHYSQFAAFKTDNIYTMGNTVGETGGVLYYELGIARPDLVLKDLIKIGHPELLPDYKFTFFQKLPN